MTSSEEMGSQGQISMENEINETNASEAFPVKKMKRYGYTGTAEYSNEHKCWLGYIEGIDALVTYDGETLEELEGSFRDKVESYIQLWRPRGVRRHYGN